MEIFKKKVTKSYNIYKEEYKFGVPKYFMVDTTQMEKIERINFDVDTRGGLKLIQLNEKVNELPENATLLLTNLSSDFIPVYARQDVYSDKNQLSISDPYKDIFENEYLKHKEKYVLWDGVVMRVTFVQTYSVDNHYGDDYNVNAYKILDDKDSH